MDQAARSSEPTRFPVVTTQFSHSIRAQICTIPKLDPGGESRTFPFGFVDGTRMALSNFNYIVRSRHRCVTPSRCFKIIQYRIVQPAKWPLHVLSHESFYRFVRLTTSCQSKMRDFCRYRIMAISLSRMKVKQGSP